MAKEKTTTDDFFEKDYKLPDSSKYMKFQPGKNKFRILSSPVTGFEYWTKEDKPVRSKTLFTETPNGKENKEGKVSISHFWAMVVYNYDMNEVQTLEITQKGIQKYIKGLTEDPEWGSPKGYDLVVTRVGSGLETKYTTVANPHKEVSKDVLEKYEAADIKLEELFEGATDF
jgi:hypothetical protein